MTNEANALGKAQKERGKDWWMHDIEPFTEDKKRAYNKYLVIKNAKDKERYKRTNRIMKKRVKERIKYGK